MGHSAHKPKSSSVDSSDQRCTKTPKNSFEGVENASCKVASLLAMQCPYSTICKWRYLVSRAFTSWGHFKSPKIVSTSLSPSTTYVSKLVKALPSRAANAKHAWKMFHEVIFPRFGTPRMVISDGGSHFIDKTLCAFLKELGAKHNIATPYHPQTSGQTETSNKQIKNIL